MFQSMASCELDYRLSNSSESMEYEDTDSDDDNKLQIVEGVSSMAGGGELVSSRASFTPRTLMRSLSAVETLKEDYQMGGGLTSDAVESLLLLGQAPTVTPNTDQKVIIDHH